MDTLAAAPKLTVSRTAPVVFSWPTNFPSFALQTKTNVSSAVAWENCSLKPAIIGTNCVVTNTLTGSARLFRLSNWPQLSCRYNLQRIGLALWIWSLDNDNLFPFHASTNWAGTMELRAIGPDGFDTNACLHFTALSNCLAAASDLACPGDLARNAAATFAGLRPENVTYRLRTGDTVNEVYPDEVLAVCPIDGNTLYCSGAVTNGLKY
jgi:hypothetical protein